MGKMNHITEANIKQCLSKVSNHIKATDKSVT